MRSLIIDLQGTARSFDSNALAQMEGFIADGDRRKTVCPMALAIPTEKPLDSVDSRAWPACYTEWWFGDAAPNLDRQRPMLFEQCAQRLYGIEEMEYSLDTGEEPYVASYQSLCKAWHRCSPGRRGATHEDVQRHQSRHRPKWIRCGLESFGHCQL